MVKENKMPVYEYSCTKCGEKFELRHSIFASSKDKAGCPKCGFADSERVYSSFCTGSSSRDSCSSIPTTPVRRFG
ncbi:zinc ribbon domain-containing protein [Chloroflexota bacterium]